MAPHLKSLPSSRAVIWISVGLAVAIGVATLMPGSAMPQDMPGSDKLHHFAAFALLTFPMIAHRPAAALWVLPLSIAYGGAIELIQPNVDRHAEWADFFADAAGALTGALAGWLTYHLRTGWAKSRLAAARKPQDA